MSRENDNASVPNLYKNDPLVKFIMKEAAKHRPLTREAEKEIFIEYNNPLTTQKRKDKIKSIIVNTNMRFVLDFALNYRGFRIHLADIISAGRVGLITAIDLFDTGRDMKFISFAVWYMKSYVSKLLETDDLVKLPSHQKVKLNREKKNKDVCDFDNETRELFQITQPWVSYDSPVGPDNDLKLGETLADPNHIDMEKSYLKAKIYENLREKLTEKLSKDESSALHHLFGLETGETLGLREVGEIMGKSHERIRQLRDSGLAKLKKSKEISSLVRIFFESSQEND